VKVITNSQTEAFFVITWFVKAPGHKMGCMNWIGVARADEFGRLLNGVTVERNQLWLVEPRPIHGVRGPKFADARLFMARVTNKPALFAIGYVRLAPKSNVKNMADYYCRASAIQFLQVRSPISQNEQTLCDYGIESVGCFPGRLCCGTQVFQPEFTEDMNHRIEAHMDCSLPKHCDDTVTPHASKHVSMPESISLNGFEVTFDRLTALSTQSHTPLKNIVPLVFMNSPENNFHAFIDFAPQHNTSTQRFTVLDMESGAVASTGSVDFSTCVLSNYRGSTQILQMSSVELDRLLFAAVHSDGHISANMNIRRDLWVTLVHKKVKNGVYEHLLVLLSGNEYNFEHSGLSTNLPIPQNCLHATKIRFHDVDAFAFPTGLAFSGETLADEHIMWEFIVSYGVDDAKPAFRTFHMLFNRKI